MEKALAPGDVACVLAEPVMTNVGIVHPEPRFHKGLRELTRKHGTLLIMDETHTICVGPGGYTREQNLEPDILVFGKPIGGRSFYQAERRYPASPECLQVSAHLGSSGGWPACRSDLPSRGD